VNQRRAIQQKLLDSLKRDDDEAASRAGPGAPICLSAWGMALTHSLGCGTVLQLIEARKPAKTDDVRNLFQRTCI
jgi:hypothetical protein